MNVLNAIFESMKELVQSQRDYFLEGHTKPLKARKETLRKLYHLLLENEQMLADAIHKDFKKSFMLTIQEELSLPYGEINHMLRKLKRWTTPKYAKTNLVNFLAEPNRQDPPGSFPGDWPLELSLYASPGTCYFGTGCREYGYP